MINVLFTQARGTVVAYWLGCWTQDSRVVGLIPTPGTVRFGSLGNFIYPDFPQYTQLQRSSNIVWEVPAMDQRPVQESQ